MATATLSNTTPVAGKTLTIVQGDSYSGTDIQWTGETADQWPDLTGAEILFGLGYGDTTLTATGTVDSPTGTQSFSVPITSAESRLLPVTQVGFYDVQGYWPATGVYKTLVRGKVIVEKSYTPPPA